jgi:hypothetical protein
MPRNALLYEKKKIHYHVYKSPPLKHFQSQFNLLPSFIHNLSNVSNFILVILGGVIVSVLASGPKLGGLKLDQERQKSEARLPSEWK